MEKHIDDSHEEELNAAEKLHASFKGNQKFVKSDENKLEKYLRHKEKLKKVEQDVKVQEEVNKQQLLRARNTKKTFTLPILFGMQFQTTVASSAAGYVQENRTSDGKNEKSQPLINALKNSINIIDAVGQAGEKPGFAIDLNKKYNSKEAIVFAAQRLFHSHEKQKEKERLDIINQQEHHAKQKVDEDDETKSRRSHILQQKRA